MFETENVLGSPFRPQSYQPKTETGFEKDEFKKHGMQKAKGVKKCIVKRELCHDKCLKNQKIISQARYV